jgi:eukaryotic-like serine/threonine-protein kinase
MRAESPNFRDIFDQAIDLASPADRNTYLDKVCAATPELRSKVEALLQAHDNASSFLDSPASFGESSGSPNCVLEGPGSVIGPYKLLEQIGEGGMGVVFMAEQTQPVQRKVALKIVKPGMDTKQVIARFDAERQALAMMDHPNIARVLDAGTTDARSQESGIRSPCKAGDVIAGRSPRSQESGVRSQPDEILTPDSRLLTPVLGRPYFVMELVRGVPITEFCDQHKLTIRERLELFINVCQAVQHAHQKGVIHRDLKPTNVLVTLHDGKAVVKVIDFGVAKAIEQKLTEKTFFTGFSQLIGTPLYMSPEQAEMSGLDLDTRSDIYSLGVLLYELLTGSTPFEGARLKSAAFDEMRRIIREEEPPRPSTRLSTLAQQAITTLSAQRKIDQQHLSRLFQGELDWIVMKALEKDRTRRYETASALAADVEHYLRDEPVQACPPTTLYRFRKFARRYRAALAIAAAFAGLLVCGIVVSGWLAIRAYKAEVQASSNEQQAQANAQHTEDVSNFLVSAFHNADPLLNGHMINVPELLDRSAKELQTKFTDDPRTKAALLEALGGSYQGLGLYREEIPLLEQARDLRVATLGPDHHDTLASTDKLVRAYRYNGRFDEAVVLAKQALKLRQAKLGADHRDTVASMVQLAGVYIDVGQWNEAVQLDQEILKFYQATLGPKHPVTLNAMGELANHYLFVARYDDALRLNEETLKLKQAILGPDHPGTLGSLEFLAEASFFAGRPDEDVSLRKEAFERCRAKLGPDDFGTLAAMLHLVDAYLQTQRYDEAARLGEEALNLIQAKLAPDHPRTLAVLASLAAAYSQLGRHSEALVLLEQSFKLSKDKLGPDNQVTLSSMYNLADADQLAGRLDESIALREEVVRLQTAKLGPNSRETMVAKNNLGFALLQQNKFAEAETFLREDLPSVRAHLAADDLALAGRLHYLALAFLLEEKFTEAEPLARESLEIRQKRIPENFHTFSSQSALGGALLGQKRYREAEPLLISGYEGIKEHLGKFPAPRNLFLRQALERLVQLYEATSQPENAAQWKKTLADYDMAESKIKHTTDH